MNARTRFLNSCLGEEIDRFFRYEHGPWPTTRKRWEAEGLPHNANLQAHFAFDEMLRLPVQSGYTHSPFWPPMERKVLEESETWIVVRDTDGITKKELKENTDTSMPQFLRFPVESRRDWELIQGYLDPVNVPHLLGDLDALRDRVEGDSPERRDFPVTLTACGAFGHPRNLLGYEKLALTLYDEPDLIKEILDNWLSLYKQILLLVCAKIQVDCLLIWEDMCYKGGPLISPRQFRTLLLPYYIALVAFARECRVSSIWVDTDGEMSRLIPLFVEADVDTLMPFEVQAGMDIVAIRKRYRDTFTIVGGIDKRVLAGDRRDIKQEVDRVLPFFVESGRFIPCLDHTVPPNVPLDNFLYYLDCVRSYER